MSFDAKSYLGLVASDANGLRRFLSEGVALVLEELGKLMHHTSGL